MNKEELKNVAYELAELKAPIALMTNFLSLVQLEFTRNDTKPDVCLMFHELVNLKGLSNMSDTLEINLERMEDLANTILDFTETKVTD